MSLNLLKSKIETYQSTQKVTKAMRNIAVVKMQRIKHQVLLVKANLVRLKKLFPEFFKVLPMSADVQIVFGPKKGLCGGLGRRALLEFSESLEQQKSQNPALESLAKCPIIASELPIAKLLVENGYHLDSCFNDLTDQAFPTLPILMRLDELSKDGKISLRIFHPSMNHHKLEFADTFYTYDAESVEQRLCLFAALEYAYYESRLCEEEKRVEAMTQASDNCDKMKDSTKIKYFKARQQKITQEILEVSN
jgi:F0F1-type ATP synthase gamma subunit